jgi:hypothetical protein
LIIVARPPSSCEYRIMVAKAPDQRHAILPWRLVAGIFLHFAVPAYLIAALIDWAVVAQADNLPALLRELVPFTGIFLLAYAAATLVCSLGAAGLDPILRARRERRLAADPSIRWRQSEERLAQAISRGRGQFGVEADSILDRLADHRWNHADERFRALATDLDDVVARSAEALAHVDPAHRPAIAQVASDAIAHIGQGLDTLQACENDRAENEARSIARYVELRYGPSDFSGSGN